MNAYTTLKRWTSVGAMLLLVAGCATPLDTTIDQAADTSFSAFGTYAWVSDAPYLSSGLDSTLANALNHQRVRQSIETELERKGYRKVSLDEADFALGYTLGTRDRVRVQQFYDTFGYYYGHPARFGRFGRINRFAFGGGFPVTTTVRTITEGTLTVDIFDNRTREAIWHGSATRSLTGDPTGAELIDAAVAALIDPLPESMVLASTDSTVGSHDMAM